VSASGQTLTIYTVNGKNTPAGVTAGDQSVNNYGYSAPTAQRRLPIVTRRSRVTMALEPPRAPSPWSAPTGVAHALTGVSWSDTTITGAVPPAFPNCPVQQQAQYGGSAARCGELVITASNGKKVCRQRDCHDRRKSPTLLAAGQSIQSAIDTARPGDLIMVPAGTLPRAARDVEPVRLQGVGAASSVLDATRIPPGHPE